MSEILPAGLQQFVQEELASGRYPTERELVVDAVRTLREARVTANDSLQDRPASQS
jgi:Arc/MetJ-type ribon-helix-helix transcriptional regulator